MNLGEDGDKGLEEECKSQRRGEKTKLGHSKLTQTRSSKITTKANLLSGANSPRTRLSEITLETKLLFEENLPRTRPFSLNNWQLIRYQFINYLSIIKINLDTNSFLVSKIISNLVNIAANYFLSLKLIENEAQFNFELVKTTKVILIN